MPDPLTLQPTVKSFADQYNRRTPPNVDYNDLLQSGWVGALDAINRYDLTRKNSLRSFAFHRIRGAILDCLRNAGLFPTRAGWPKVEVLRLDRLVLFDDVPDGAEESEKTSYIDVFSDDRTPHWYLEEKEKYLPVLREIKKLPWRTKEIIWLYFWQEYPMKEIGDIWGLTEARISQIITKVENTLQKRLTYRYKK